ncbi:hypothetical protein [Stenotrophomonas sp. RAC2]|uniref:hypothetical protein n=1 Tax=Stenotrophomonas sp. RAC2 TaxID=3064902 RepID=UPI0027250A56|nr:hypothetical protein [Stenotrophomonas sp. RAC2]MDV9042024.1 hypothetical protein [Stenotrophomonas sp. RAC2]
MPIELTVEQEALLRLPEPESFTGRIAAEIRRDMPEDIHYTSDQQLSSAVRESYDFATYELHITRVPTLVRWVRADTTHNGLLRREPAVVLKMKVAANPNLAAEDLLSIFRAQTNWRN